MEEGKQSFSTYLFYQKQYSGQVTLFFINIHSNNSDKYLFLFSLLKYSVNHVFSSPTSIINFTPQKQSYDDTRRSNRDNELLQRAQGDL